MKPHFYTFLARVLLVIFALGVSVQHGSCEPELHSDDSEANYYEAYLAQKRGGGQAFTDTDLDKRTDGSIFTHVDLGKRGGGRPFVGSPRKRAGGRGFNFYSLGDDSSPIGLDKRAGGRAFYGGGGGGYNLGSFYASNYPLLYQKKAVSSGFMPYYLSEFKRAGARPFLNDRF